MPVSGCGFVTPTAQQVINSVSSDLLQRIAPEDPVLLDYTNRIQLQILRISRWQFLLSDVQRFITQEGRTDYWIGPVGQGPNTAVETNLNILNIGPIKTDTFYDRSNFRQMSRFSEGLLSSTFAYRDSTSRLMPPRGFRVSPTTPCTINLYPAPDNQNQFQPVPEAPVCSTAVAGALTARFYFVRVTFVDSLGNESAASLEARVFIPANSVLVVQPPIEPIAAASGVQYNRYNVYVFNAGTSTTMTTASGQETLVNASPISTTLAFQEPNLGVPNNGVAYPTANNVEPLLGYVMEFRYFQAKPQVTALNQSLFIPIDYFDVLVAGVNYLTAQFLKETDSIQYWKSEYDAGIIGMIRDKNLFPRGPEFISPDPASQSIGEYFGYETIDQVNFPQAG